MDSKLPTHIDIKNFLKFIYFIFQIFFSNVDRFIPFFNQTVAFVPFYGHTNSHSVPLHICTKIHEFVSACQMQKSEVTP